MRNLKFEQLERREVLTTIGLVDGVLEITGDAGNDRVTITNGNAGTFRVRTDVETIDFDKADVQSLIVNTFEGRDRIMIYADGFESIEVDAGDGDDYIALSRDLEAAPPTLNPMAAGGVRWRSFGNSGGKEMYVGEGVVNPGSRTEKDFTWQSGTYDVSLRYDPVALELEATIDGPGGQQSALYNLNAPLGNLDSFEIQVADRDGGELDFIDVEVDGMALGDFPGDGPGGSVQSYGVYSDLLGDGFELTGKIVVTDQGSFSASQELSRVQVIVGQEFAPNPGPAFTLLGGAGDDLIVSSNADEYVDGGEGDDRIATYGGRDIIFGGPGSDHLNGGAGDDQIHGGDGDDYLFGDLGNDTLLGDDGDDVINGYLGDDVLRGGNGNDELLGGADNDLLEGGLGADRLRGESGDDVLWGNVPGTPDDGEVDLLFGDTGADELGAGLEDEIMDFVVGEDTLL